MIPRLNVLFLLTFLSVLLVKGVIHHMPGPPIQDLAVAFVGLLTITYPSLQALRVARFSYSALLAVGFTTLGGICTAMLLVFVLNGTLSVTSAGLQ